MAIILVHSGLFGFWFVWAFATTCQGDTVVPVGINLRILVFTHSSSNAFRIASSI